MGNFEIITFDLDDTLLDTSAELIPNAAKEACHAMIGGGLVCDLQTCLRVRDEFLRK